MDKKKLLLGGLAAAAAIEVVLIVVGILMICQLQQTRELIQTGLATQQTEFTDTGRQEAPSIMAGSSVAFGGKDTVSTEKGTIELKVSATPSEFKNGTKAKVKIGDKSYKLKQDDNSFSGTFPVSVFEPIDTAVLALQDGDMTRSEELLDYEMEPLCPSRISWEILNEGLQFNKSAVNIDTELSAFDFSGTNLEFSSAWILARAGDKILYKAALEEYFAEDDTAQTFRWTDKVSPLKADADFYVEAKDKYGFIYRYKLGTLGKNQAAIEPAEPGETVLEVENSKGETLLKRNVEDIQEVEDEI